MSRELFPPRPPQGADGVEQNITAIRVELQYDPDSPNGTSFSGGSSRFFYAVNTYDQDGNTVEEQTVRVAPGALPAPILQALRDLITFCDSDGESRGLIGTGTFTLPF